MGWFILIIIVGFILWLLLAPIRLILDSENRICAIQWSGIGSARLVSLPDDLVVRLRVFFWQKQFSVFNIKSTKKKSKGKKKKSTKKKDFGMWRQRGMNLLKSFRIKTFRLNLDTDDFVQNSYLYPIFHLLNTKNRQLQINYKGNLELLLIVENRLFNIIKSFII